MAEMTRLPCALWPDEVGTGRGVRMCGREMKLTSSGSAAQSSPKKRSLPPTLRVTDIEAAILSMARRGLLLTSNVAGQTPEIRSLVQRGHLSSVLNHDLGQHILVFELTNEGKAAREAQQEVLAGRRPSE